MSNKKLTFSQVIKKIDNFEKKFANNAGYRSLLEFFEVFGKIINEGGYTYPNNCRRFVIECWS